MDLAVAVGVELQRRCPTFRSVCVNFLSLDMLGSIVSFSQVFQSLSTHELLLNVVDLVLFEVVHLFLIAETYFFLDDLVLERVLVLIASNALFFV